MYADDTDPVEIWHFIFSGIMWLLLNSQQIYVYLRNNGITMYGSIFILLLGYKISNFQGE